MSHTSQISDSEWNWTCSYETPRIASCSAMPTWPCYDGMTNGTRAPPQQQQPLRCYCLSSGSTSSWCLPWLRSLHSPTNSYQILIRVWWVRWDSNWNPMKSNLADITAISIFLVRLDSELSLSKLLGLLGLWSDWAWTPSESNLSPCNLNILSTLLKKWFFFL